MKAVQISQTYKKQQTWFDCHNYHFDLDSGDDTNDVDDVSTVAVAADDDEEVMVGGGGGGGAPRGAVEARVPFSKHINVARAVFRPQNRWKRYLYTWVMGFSVFFCDFWMVLVFCLCFFVVLGWWFQSVF